MVKHISEKQEEQLIERLIGRVNDANTAFLINIGKSIKKIKNLNYNQANQLVQMLKYGGNYEQILNDIAKYADKNVNEIDELFSEYAKKDQQFYKQFYEYRDVPYVPYEQNVLLQRQTQALANMVKNEMYNFTRSNVLGYTISDNDGNPQFLGLRDTYNRVLDEALLNVSMGKQGFDTAMSSIMREIGGSGLKTIEFDTGRSMRLDSAVRMHLSSRLKELHNENEQIFGQEFDADGVEISVHSNPADDHAEAQGRQFTKEQFELLQTTGTAEDITGKVIDMHRVTKKGVSYSFRPISEMNCRHYIFSIVVGVSEPEYSDEQLEQIQSSNEAGFMYEGEHFTNYQGTQLQRKIESEVRRQKDIQILAKAGDNKTLMAEAQQKITALTNKYKELSRVSGLQTKMDRLTVSGYKRTAVKTTPTIPDKFASIRNWVGNNSLVNINENFNYKQFINKYEGFYNTLDKNEVQKALDDYHDWLSSDRTASNPIGKFLNKKTGYDALPELINEKEFWKNKNINQLPSSKIIDNKHWVRGIGDQNSDAIENISKYVRDFKYGEFYAGVGHNGNGTYVSKNFDYVLSHYGKIENNGLLYIMPKSNAKIIGIDKIDAISRNIEKYITDDNGDLYYKLSLAILKDNGYLAEILGFDIVDLGDHKIILNRGSVKVVK